jgi:predicted ferric reductase/Ca2+-binding EF-hand superfamily protein
MSETGRPSVIDAELLSTLEKAFAHHAGADARIDRAELQKALGLRSEYLANRVFALLDADGDGAITRDEFFAGVRGLVFGSDRDKLLFAFRLHDHDGDGFLDRTDLLRMISVSLAESDIVERAGHTAEQLVSALLRAADADRDGRLSFADFEAHVRKRPALLHKMTRNEAIWIAPNEELLLLLDERGAGKAARPSSRWGYAGPVPSIVLGVFFAANVILFAIAWMRGAASAPPVEHWARLGHALARCASLDGALILFPVMRRLLTRVRATWIGRALPVDDATDFHRVVGHTLFAVSALHALSFLAAYAVGHASLPLVRILRTGRGATGAVLLLVFVVMWIFSLRFVRRSRLFELFYFTHLLYVAWFVLAILHAPSFAFWAGVPLAGFVVEQIVRIARRAPASAVRSKRALRSGVTRLEIERPPGLTFRAGDYCFLCIPAIARHEWHPFTISSAPERDRLVFHVRSLGDWTNALRRRAEADGDKEELVAYVDGPYGSPSTRIFDTRFAVLIGAGIGVTPFASVLESLVLRQRAARPAKLEKAHFFWLNKDPYSFEWFGELLAGLEAQDSRGLLDIHLCMTGARTGVTAMGLEIARDAMWSSGRSDIITGLRTQTHVGPPDWDTFLSAIAKAHAPEQVHVFYCGPPDLGAKLRPVCEGHGMTFREERF